MSADSSKVERFAPIGVCLAITAGVLLAIVVKVGADRYISLTITAIVVTIIATITNLIYDAIMAINKKWDTWVIVQYVLTLFVASQLIASILLVSYFTQINDLSIQAAADKLTNETTPQFIYILLAEVATITAVYFFVRFFRVGLSTIGLRKPRLSDIWRGLILVIPYYITYLLVVTVVSQFVSGLNVDQKQEIGFDNVHGTVGLTLTFIGLVMLPPLAEEILVRGLLYSGLKKSFKIIPAAIGTSLIFAAAHLPEGGAAGPLYIAGIDTFLLSLYLVYLRERTGGLWAGMTLHAIKNGVAFIALFIIGTR